MRLAKLMQLRELQRKAATLKKGVSKYYYDPVGFAQDCINWQGGSGLTAYQYDIMKTLVDKNRICVRGPHGLGKAESVHSPILAGHGWSTIGELSVGDTVFDENGHSCTVIAKSPVWLGATYEVEFADGSVITTHANHEWNAIDVYNRPKTPRPDRRTIPVADWRDHWDATKTVTTEFMFGTQRTRGGQPRWRVPTARPLDFPEDDLPIDPYLLGAWLGDGDTGDGALTLNRTDSAEMIPLLGDGHCVPSGERTGSVRYRPNGLRTALRLGGLLGSKHIPQQYMRASVEQRRELVRGLWDTDGYKQAGAGGTDEITLTCERLALDVVELLHALGLVVRVRQDRAQLNGKDMGPRWRIGVRFDFRPYHLSRYAWTEPNGQASRFTQRTIIDIRRVGDQPTQCIEVDSPSHLYLCGRSLIPTHNSAVSALTILWFALTSDAAGVDWKCVYTAGAWRQIIQYLSPEIRKWSARLRWDRVRDRPFNSAELLNLSLRLQHGSAFGAACSNPALIEGAHADRLMFLFDESKSIPAGTFDACEGAFSGTGETYAMALSTPGVPSGRFYDIQSHKPGYEDWHVRHVTVQEAIDAGRISEKWMEDRRRQWGETSALFQNRVLGEFHAGEEDSVIPLSWAEAAAERWHEWNEAGRADPGKPHTMGVDVARSGSDKTVFAIRWGHVVTELRTYSHADTMTTSGRAMAVLDADPAMTAIVDVIGVGAGVYDRLREQGAKVQAFNASAKSNRKDSTGELGFINTRAAAWQNLREMLDPSAGAELCLPDDDELMGDLTAPKMMEPMSGGKLKLESKDDIKERIGRSTDRGDAVVQACFTERGTWLDAYGIVTCQACGHKFPGSPNGVRREKCPKCSATIEEE